MTYADLGFFPFFEKKKNQLKGLSFNFPLNAKTWLEENMFPVSCLFFKNNRNL